MKIQDIVKQFDYLTKEEVENNLTEPRLRGGYLLSDLFFERIKRVAQRENVKEGVIVSEIVKNFITGTFHDKDTVSRSVYTTTVEENEKLTTQVEQLMGIINTLETKLKASESKHQASGSWPTPTAQPPANQPAKPYANAYAQPFANGHANGYANAHANGYANAHANGYAANHAEMASVESREQALSITYPVFANYLMMLSQSSELDININQQYAWTRQTLRLPL